MYSDPSLLNEFLQESREHLASIETDLLAMEEAGANLDENLVNQVFRAAHSIKGGAGFFNLENTQKLAHRLENALDMIRSREMVPTPEVVNLLLLGFDRLRDMINNPAASETVEIDDLVVALLGLATAHLPAGEKETLTNQVPLPGSLLKLSEFDLNQATKKGKCIFILDIDLLHDIHRRGKTPWHLMKELMACGTILDCAWELDTLGTLDDEPVNTIPFQVLYCTVLESEILANLVDLPLAQITLVPGKPLPAPTPAPPPQAAPVALSPERKVEPDPESSASALSTKPAAPAGPGTSASTESGGDTTLRVSLSLLEELMNLAGEMVLGRNQLMEAISRQDARAITAGAQRINLVTSELQLAIMLTRMQPVGTLLNRFPRVVRDLSLELGKEIQLRVTGRDVEMDRSILEGLSDPLTHMVRNAVDHGIEGPAQRQAAGKSPTGIVDIRVFHEAGQVVVEIQDDGKGLDPARLSAKAVEKQLLTPEQARALSSKELMGLIFLPGFSTADQVSKFSGRGVGMDVVKTNIEKLSGTIDIESEVGQGSTFRIKLPLTLAIVPSLLVSVGEERFAIPQINVAELIRIAPDQVAERIEVVGEAEVLILRGQLIPLVRLSEALGVPATFTSPESGERQQERRQRLADRRGRKHKGRGEPPEGNAHPAGHGADLDAPDSGSRFSRRDGDRRQAPASELNVVVVNAGLLCYGIVVETLHDTVEIVVKPMGRHLKPLREYAGATILGDGGVALIVDVVSLASLLGMASQGGTLRAAQAASEVAHERYKDRHAFLLFHNGPDEACAVPLEQVARVEQVERKKLEFMGGRWTLQYRGSSLPLVALKDTAAVSDFHEDQSLVVIVFSAAGREVGLLGALPVDSVEVDVAVDSQTHRQPGIAGSAIIHGRTTLVLDIHEIVAQVIPEALPSTFARSTAQGVQTILLAEDSDFFRHQVRKYLESDGYTVVEAEDGEVAWKRLLEQEGAIQAVVSDIEMPRMDGFQLIEKIRGESRFAQLPVIAVTSLAGEEDILRGKALGFTDYQIKLDKERLLESLRALLLTRTQIQPEC